jgi:hypothetical protein
MEAALSEKTVGQIFLVTALGTSHLTWSRISILSRRKIHILLHLNYLLLSIFVPVAPTWSIGHPWNASFHFSFVILWTVGRTPWTGDQPVARPLPTHRTTRIQTKCKETSMFWVIFEPTMPLLERENTFHALDWAATVIDVFGLRICKM